jgi:hypothetical protein
MRLAIDVVIRIMLKDILHTLKAERDRIDHAIAVLNGPVARIGCKRRTMSAAARAKIAAAQRARWAKQKTAHKASRK